MPELGLRREGDTLHLDSGTGSGHCGAPAADTTPLPLDQVMWRQEPGGPVNFLRPSLCVLCPACEALSRDEVPAARADALGNTTAPSWTLQFGT